MFSFNKKKDKKFNIKEEGYGGFNRKQLKDLGKIPIEINFLTKAGQRWQNAQRFIPFFYRSIQVFCTVIILSMIVMVGSIFLRPNPLLLVSFPDGSVRCAGENINMNKHILKQRSNNQLEICQELDRRWSTPLTDPPKDNESNKNPNVNSNK